MEKKYRLPSNIKIIRKKWKFQQEEFSEIFNTGRATISHYETGRNIPDIFFLVKLQDMTGINARRLCYEELGSNDIPKAPLSEGYADRVEEPRIPYGDEDLYNYHRMVDKVQALEKIVLELQKLFHSKNS